VSLGCEVDAGWIHKTSTKTRQPSPADKIQTVVPKMLVTQFFRYKNKRYTSPPVPLIARLLKRPSSQHTHNILLNTPFSYFLFYFVYKLRNTSYHLIDMFFWGAYWYKGGDCHLFAKLLPRETTKVATGSLLSNNKQTEFLVFIFFIGMLLQPREFPPTISFE
jgi:hypothetical protein